MKIQVESVADTYFDPRDFVTGEVIKNVYDRKHKLIFVFTNDTPARKNEWMQAIDDSWKN